LYADLHPVPDRRDISLKNLPRRPPVQKISIEKRDFSLDKAIPHRAAARDTERDRDDAIAEIKKRVHRPTR
jgi:hypothetical protein